MVKLFTAWLRVETPILIVSTVLLAGCGQSAASSLAVPSTSRPEPAPTQAQVAPRSAFAEASVAALGSAAETPTSAASPVIAGAVTTSPAAKPLTAVPTAAVASLSTSSGSITVRAPCQTRVFIYEDKVGVQSGMTNAAIHVAPGVYDVTVDVDNQGGGYVQHSVSVEGGRDSPVDISAQFGAFTLIGYPQQSLPPIYYDLMTTSNQPVQQESPRSGNTYCVAPGVYGISIYALPHWRDSNPYIVAHANISASRLTQSVPADWNTQFGALSIAGTFNSANAAFGLLDPATGQSLGNFSFSGFATSWVAAGQYKILLEDMGPQSGGTVNINVQPGAQVPLQVPQ